LRRATARLCWGATIVYWVVLFAGTHAPALTLSRVPVTDKTIHFVMYALLGAALMVSLSVSGRLKSTSAVTVLAILLAYGAVDEWTQALPFINRSCEMADWHADAAGAAVAVVLMSLVLRGRSSLP
jgi:VanZ family protein